MSGVSVLQTSSKKSQLFRLVLAASFVLPLCVVAPIESQAKGLTPGQVRLLAKYGPIIKARQQRNHPMTTGK